MKTRVKNPWPPPTLIAGLGLMLTAFCAQAAVVLTTLHSFTGGTEGAGPRAGLVQGRDGHFYGTTAKGGTNDVAYGGLGTVFKISSNGALTNLHQFTGGHDGSEPYAGLVQGRDGNFYGTTYTGGSTGVYNYGTVFKITGTGALTSLHFFTGNDGWGPEAGLVEGGDGNFYGTTESGYPDGTVFKISANGALTTLHSFTDGNGGANSVAGLVQGTDGKFYGTTKWGGTNGGYGTVFTISTNAALTSLYSFSGIDGAYPQAGLVQGSDGNFYGTTYSGGAYTNQYGTGYGTVFRISANGALTILRSFSGSDGANPVAGLVQGSDGNFYGTTSYDGGTNSAGTVFKISTNGALTTLHSFTGGEDGGSPYAGLVQGSDGNFYGTTYYGGTSNLGTVFRVSIVPPPELTIVPCGSYVVLRWPTNVAGFDYSGFILQSTTNLVSPAVWANVSGGPVVVNGQNTVTNPVSSAQQFFRLTP